MQSQSFKNKLLFFLFLILLFASPLNIFSYPSKVYIGGENVGISVKSKGILIVGFYEVNGINPGKAAGLKIGDRIIKIDNNSINEVDELSKNIDSKSQLLITYVRNNKEYQTMLQMQKNHFDIYKTGMYVKDSIIGIGTLTFVDPITKTFGALGHEISEKETKTRFEVDSGKIFKSTITNIIKSSRNSPGEKNAIFSSNDIYGTIKKNTISGIYGSYKLDTTDKELYQVADSITIETGNATIRTVITGNIVEEFDIKILKINKSSKTKNILFEITDPALLKKTNGIVQGMSGSPIIQNNKIVGAITHVLVDNPIRGYGIFITTMLEEIEN